LVARPTEPSVCAGHGLIAAIVPTPQSTMYIQAFGSAARVVAEREAFLAFVKGIH
jgi:hypothetical protein